MRSRVLFIFFLMVVSIPFLLGITRSFVYSLGLTGLLNTGFTLYNWDLLISKGSGFQAILYTLFLTIISLVLTLGLSLGLTWFMFKKRGSKGYSFILTPLLFAPIAAALSWYYILAPSGIISRIAFSLGIVNSLSDFPRLVNDVASMGVLITHVFLVLPVFSLIFISISQKERLKDLSGITKSLGGGDIDFLRKVFIPVLLSRGMPVIVLYGVFLFGTYEVPLLLGSSSPQVVSIFIVEKLSRYNLKDIPLGHAMVVLYGIVTIVFSVALMKNKRIYSR